MTDWLECEQQGHQADTYVLCSPAELHKVIIDAIQARIPGPVSEYDTDGIAEEVARWDETSQRFRVHVPGIIDAARRHEIPVQFDALDMHDLMNDQGTPTDTDPDTLAALWQQLGWQWAHTTAAAHPNRRVVIPPPPPDLAAQLWAIRTQRPVWEHPQALNHEWTQQA